MTASLSGVIRPFTFTVAAMAYDDRSGETLSSRTDEFDGIQPAR
jgi:hypothetical protein